MRAWGLSRSSLHLPSEAQPWANKSWASRSSPVHESSQFHWNCRCVGCKRAHPKALGASSNTPDMFPDQARWRHRGSWGGLPGFQGNQGENWICGFSGLVCKASQCRHRSPAFWWPLSHRRLSRKQKQTNVSTARSPGSIVHTVQTTANLGPDRYAGAVADWTLGTGCGVHMCTHRPPQVSNRKAPGAL